MGKLHPKGSGASASRTPGGKDAAVEAQGCAVNAGDRREPVNPPPPSRPAPSIGSTAS